MEIKNNNEQIKVTIRKGDILFDKRNGYHYLVTQTNTFGLVVFNMRGETYKDTSSTTYATLLEDIRSGDIIHYPQDKYTLELKPIE